MKRPRGSLTGNQYQILQAIWDAGPGGLTVAEIWRALGGERVGTRTTVLNQVARLVKRGWLRRRRDGSVFRHLVAVPRDEVDRELAAGFLSDFFGDSPLQAFSSMLSAGACGAEELKELRRLVDDALERCDDDGVE